MSEAKAKPTGPIPPYFQTLDGELAIGGKTASALVAEAGDTPLFVYSTAALDARIGELRAAMPGQLGIHYAMKANPFAPLLGWMKDRVDGFDVASGGELKLALDAGVAADRISFAGPGKRDRELDYAIANGVTLNCESEGEAERAFAIGARIGVAPKIAVRVNPSFDLKGSGMKMGGGAKPFGVDAARVPALVKRIVAAGAEWCGFHIFAGSQALDADAIIAMQAQTLALAAELAEAAGAAPPKVNLGGGLGIPYFPGDNPIDLAAVGGALGQALSALPAILQDTHFCIELGRYLVGEADLRDCEDELRLPTSLRALATGAHLSLHETYQALHQLMDQKLVRVSGDEIIVPDCAALGSALCFTRLRRWRGLVG